MAENKFIPFALPDIGEEEVEAVSQTLRSGWVTTGPVTKNFESKFAAYIGGNVDAISVNSATAGLHLALEACGISEGNEVIVRYLGADPVFVDCDLTTLCLDINQIESKITPKTKAIIPVHLGGLPCDMDRIIAIAKKYNLRVIEDAAHTCPSKINNIMIGQHDSDAVVYSFYANKTITTGEGGMIITKNPAIAKRCRIMRLHGMSKDAFDRFTATTPAWYYEIVAPGYKYNLTDIASSLGICQLAKADRFQAIRQKMAERYLIELADLPLILPPQIKNPLTDLHSWHLFCCQLNTDKICRNDFIQAMSDNGIGTSVHYIPLHMQPYWKNRYNLTDEQFPNASQYFKNAVTLPLYTKMSVDEQSRVIDTVRMLLS